MSSNQPDGATSGGRRRSTNPGAAGAEGPTSGEAPDGNVASSSAGGGTSTTTKQPSCFVIGPIGREGSEARKRSDQLLRHIIDPVISGLGYSRPLRADRISESGRITRQIIQHIVEDDLVVADLTDSNPNVYYELALRHAVKMPFVQILAGEDPLPFDVADQRTIMVDHRDLDSVSAAKDELARQVEAIKSGIEIDNPLTFAVDVASLRGSENPGDRTQGEILQMLEELRNTSRVTARAVNRSDVTADIDALRHFVEVVSQAGSVVDQDVDNLTNPFTSSAHSRWVKQVKQNMNPFLPYRRDTPTVDPLPSPEEPPF
ncbi:hypothetical protein [uncultured Pseudokineococcus sp.]|uniref:hypothetical protein n=1 Tax=uncultured Pseudokineococcus sp. TaxID=1642928 RepID=UPI00260E91A4|nr:hypothetical protein [uncultured Pseudokineococcus sp.]